MWGQKNKKKQHVWCELLCGVSVVRLLAARDKLWKPTSCPPSVQVPLSLWPETGIQGSHTEWEFTHTEPTNILVAGRRRRRRKSQHGVRHQLTRLIKTKRKSACNDMNDDYFLCVAVSHISQWRCKSPGTRVVPNVISMFNMHNYMF